MAVRSAQVGHQDDRSGACIIEVAMMTIHSEVNGIWLVCIRLESTCGNMRLALLDSILDSRQRSDDSLQCQRSQTKNIISYASLFIWHLHRTRPQALAHSRVGDLVGLLVLRNVEIDPDQDLFALEGDVGDGELAREGHGDWMRGMVLYIECVMWMSRE